MKLPLSLLGPLALALVTVATRAAITIPGITGTAAAGADGAVNRGEFQNLVVDLAAAEPASWDAVPTKQGVGVYDSNRWAVVFKYSSVRLDSNLSVTFQNHPSGAPVVWLVSGDVEIGPGAVVRLDGQAGSGAVQTGGFVASAGPGGFRGGRTTTPAGEPGSGGFGPGGGFRAAPPQVEGNGGAFRTRVGSLAGETYGAARAMPLIGGSGGGSNRDGGFERGGGGGGGALLIVASGRVIVNGKISASGGTGGAGGGAGGAIRIIASEVSGTGRLEALGGVSEMGSDAYAGGAGVIALEALSFAGTVTAVPAASSTPLVEPVQIWPADSEPITRIVSVGGVAAPRDPKAGLDLIPADLSLAAGASRRIVIETRNLPLPATCRVFITPAYGQRLVRDAVQVSGNFTQALWEVNLDPALTGKVALQVRAFSN